MFKTLLTFTVGIFVCGTSQASDFFNGVSADLGKCYSREYTQKELDESGQNITHMAAKLSLENFGDPEAEPIPFLTIQGKGRNSDRVYGIEFACDRSGYCFIDCDGPRTQLQWSVTRQGSIVIDARDDFNFQLDPLLCGDEEIEGFEALAPLLVDNDLFRLDPMPDYQCF